MGRFILILLLILLPANAALADGCISYRAHRTFTIDERFVFVISALLSKETTEKLLAIHHGILSGDDIEEITLERREEGRKWFLRIKYKADIAVNCVPLDLDVVMALERRYAQIVAKTSKPIGRIMRSTTVYKIKKLDGDSTQVAMTLDVTVWRKFPNLFRRKATQIVHSQLHYNLYQSERVIRESVPIVKEKILNEVSEITEEYLELLWDSF